MKTYIVGGAVRDKLMHLVPKDVDYVVVGATPEQMISQGFSIVGNDFPVFLHPLTGDEYALARRERKVGVGYGGFEFDTGATVSLEEDLYRRDLTINAMAIDPSSGELFDPFGGQRDIRDRILRHVSPAFAEDPVRVLRTARFAARYGFSIHPDTIQLMMEVTPEIQHVAPDRVVAEIVKGAQEPHVGLMLKALVDCKATEVSNLRVFLSNAQTKIALADKFTPQTPTHVRIVALLSGTDKELEQARVPSTAIKHKRSIANNYDALLKAGTISDVVNSVDIVRTFTNLRAYSSHAEFMCLLDIAQFFVMCGSDEPTSIEWRLTVEDRYYQTKAVDAEEVALTIADKSLVREAIINARAAALQ